MIDGEYIWKYTHKAYDFSFLGATPITFPIEWESSKIPGYAIRSSMPNFHGLTAFIVMSSVAARFFGPQVSGIGATPGAGGGVFRIDHDELFNETTHQNDDHNPLRISSRNLFDAAIGHDNIFHGDRYKWSARLTVINMANKEALYNFLSTFSGTHYVTPRAITATIGFHF